MKQQKLKQIPLRLVLIVPFVLQIVGAVGLVGYLSYRSGQKAVEDMAKPLMTEIGDRIDKNLINYLHKPTEVVKNNAAVIKLGMINWRDLTSIERYFWQQSQIFNDVNSIAIANEQKEILIIQKQDHGSRVIYNWDNYLADSQGKAIVLSAGCDDFLRKPFAEQTIFDALAKHLGVQYIFAQTNSPVLDDVAESALTSQQLTYLYVL
ncbi:hypothetical protein [Anabaena sp. UHCC 0451]|uniref:hypothetical protein n=1 Tax=Anabaena sp. UHCC 0451 TaxID=2055235 RepID=UPI002B2091C5|nr:hypothetical protein [Anabaena sp. UHCC 0451]MEA5576364.1 hypothetical protein [Anabaena sp. UHCC 0451]